MPATATAKLDWKGITVPYMHGIVTEHGNRKAEVVRAYQGEWLTFHYTDGRMERGENTKYPTMAAAKRIATNWILS